MLGFITLPAHPGQPLAPHDLWQAWNLAPGLLFGQALLAGLYVRGWRAKTRRGGQAAWRGAAFAGGWLALMVALVSPLDRLASALFAAHMLQHMLLIVVAAPLLALSAPLGTLLLGLPAALRVDLGRAWQRAGGVQAAWQVVSLPLVAWGLHASAMWVWHIPALYQAALATEWLHQLEHVVLLGTGWLFWWVGLHPAPRAAWLRGPGVALYLFTLALQSGLLGALLTFAPRPWYGAYAATTAAWGLTPLADQQLAGAGMWVPAGVIYTVAALVVLGVWLHALERRETAPSVERLAVVEEAI